MIYGAAVPVCPSPIPCRTVWVTLRIGIGSLWAYLSSALERLVGATACSSKCR